MGVFDPHAHYDSGAFNQDRLEVLAGLPQQGVELIVNPGCDLPSSRKALELGATDVVIVGGLGGARLDHTLANLQTLVFLAKNGVCATLADTDNEVTALLPGTHRIQARPGWYFSIFSAGEQAPGVTLEGLKYPLHDYTLTHAFPIGVSNEFAAETATLRFSAGMIYLVLSRKEPPRG